jgi:hypothetical protein
MQRRLPYRQLGDDYDTEAVRQFISGTGVLVGFDPDAYPDLLSKKQWRLGIRALLGTADEASIGHNLRRHELVALSRALLVETPEDGVRANTLRYRISQEAGHSDDYGGDTALREAELRYAAVMLAGNHHDDEDESVTVANTEERLSAGNHS